MIIRKKQKTKAFTLVEIILALAVLGVGLVSILSLFAVGTHSARRTLNYTKASLFAQLTFEQLKLLSITDYNNNLLANGQHAENAINTVSARPFGYAENPEFTRSLNVEDSQLVPDSSLKKLILTITWENNSEVFITYVAKYSP